MGLCTCSNFVANEKVAGSNLVSRSKFQVQKGCRRQLFCFVRYFVVEGCDPVGSAFASLPFGSACLTLPGVAPPEGAGSHPVVTKPVIISDPSPRRVIVFFMFVSCSGL
jgi:hypothetical protein